MYNIYKIARNKAWETLIESNIRELPVSLTTIAKTQNILLIGKNNVNYDGYSININNNKLIYYNKNNNIKTIRFVIAHELGHCILNHINENEITQTYLNEHDDYTSILELQANIFARGILMPATVLNSLNVNSAAEISELCNVSYESAKIKYQRLLELKSKNTFNQHYLEEKIYNNFQNYINKKNKIK